MAQQAEEGRTKLQIRYTRSDSSASPIPVQGAISSVVGSGPNIILHLYSEFPCVKDVDELQVELLGGGVRRASGPEQPIADDCLERNISATLIMTGDVARNMARVLTVQAERLREMEEQTEEIELGL